jgi:hypothetical protein
MAAITIVPQTIPNWQGDEESLELRVYSSHDFYDSDDNLIPAGKPGSEDFFLSHNCPINDGVIAVPGIVLSSTTDVESVVRATPRYTAALYDGKGDSRKTILANFRLPDDFMFDTATWNEIALFNTPSRPPTPEGSLNAAQIYELLAQYSGLVAAPLATHLIAGKTKLDTAPAIGNPIAVGINSQKFRYIDHLTGDAVGIDHKDWVAMTRIVNMEKYDNILVNALAAIGVVERVTLRFTQEVVAPPGTTIIPDNIDVQFQSGGSLKVATGRKVIIMSMRPHPPQQYFFGSGDVVLGMGATAGVFQLEWWAGPGNSGVDVRHAFDQVKLSAIEQSQNDQGMGVLKMGPGEFLMEGGFELWNHCLIEGVGYDPDAGAYDPDAVNCTVVRITAESAAVDPYLWRIPIHGRMFAFKNFTLSTYHENVIGTANCIHWDQPNDVPPIGSTFAVQFDRIGFQGAYNEITTPLDIDQVPAAAEFGVVSTNVNAELVHVTFKQCWFQATLGIHMDTTNTNFTLDSNTFQPLVHGTCVKSRGHGWIQIINNDARGQSGGYVLTSTAQRTIASASVSVTDIPYGQPAFPTAPPDFIFSRITLDPATPLEDRFGVNDHGQSIHFETADPPFDAYLLEIEDEFNGILSYHPQDELGDPVALTNLPATMHRWDDFENQSYCVFDFSSYSNQVNIVGGVDEAIIWSLRMGGNTFDQVTSMGYTYQGKIGFTAGAVFQSAGGNRFMAHSFHDFTDGPYVMANFQPSDLIGNHVYNNVIIVKRGDVWGTKSNNAQDFSRTQHDFAAKARFAPDFQSSNYHTIYDYRQNSRFFYNGWEIPESGNPDLEGGPNQPPLGFDEPIIGIYDTIRRNAVDFVQKNLLRLGVVDPFTRKPLWHYDFVHNDYDGRLYIESNRAADSPDKGLVMDGLVKGKFFLPTSGGEIMSIGEEFANNAVLTDTALQADLIAGFYEIEIEFDVSSTVQGLKLDFASDTTFIFFNGQWHSYTANLPAQDPVIARIAAPGTVYNGVNVNGHYRFRGGFLAEGPGTITLRAAQNAADASNTTMLAGARMRVNLAYQYGTS